MPMPSPGAPACALTKWPSAASTLFWHACTPPAEAPASLDAQLALIRPKLSRDESYKVGKLSRGTLHLLFDEVRYTSGNASLEASWDALSCALRYAYGQRREDLFLLPLLLNALRSEPTGRAQTFVELGALDGMSMSNTYMLERCFSWKGLLVEANPANYVKLAASPRNVTKRHAAVCAGDGSAGATVRMSIAGDNFAAMADLVDTKRKRHVGDGVVEVGCRSLTQLMREAGLHDGATFLSLDVSRKEFRTARASHASAKPPDLLCHICAARPRGTCEANGPANQRSPAPAKRGPHAICVWRVSWGTLAPTIGFHRAAQVEGAEALVLENVDPSRFSVVMAEASPQHKESNARVEQLLRRGGLHNLGRLMDSVVWGREHAWRHFARGFP